MGNVKLKSATIQLKAQAGGGFGSVPNSIKTAHVFIESGQSNCQGVAPREDAPNGSDPGPIVGVKTWRRSKDGTMYSGTGAWYNLDYEYNQYEGRDQFGSVLKFGLNISATLHDANNDIYIIKADGNGRPILGWMSGGAEHTAMYDGHITPALASLVADPTIDQIKIHGFYWDQGESDCDSSSNANNYEGRLTALISELRSTVGIADLPIIIRQLDTNVLTATYRDTVIAAQQNVSALDADVHLLETSYTYLPDNLHLDGQGQNDVGDDRHALITAITTGALYNG